MAIIRELFPKVGKKQQDRNLDYREKIRAHKLSVFIRTIVAVAVIVALVVILNLIWKEKTYSGFTVLSSAPLSIVSGAEALNLDGNILVYSKDGAGCFDPKGKAVWNESYEMQSPIVSICGQTVAIGDYNGREIYVANKSKVLGTVKTNLPIRSLTVSDTGMVMAVLDDVDVIRMYGYDGNTDTDEPVINAKASMNKSGYPISISLTPNGKLMMVSYFHVDGGSMRSSVSFYNFGEVGENNADNFVSGFDYDNSILPYVKFMDNRNAFGLSNDRLVFFQGPEIPNNSATAILNEKVIGVYNNQNYVGLVYLDSTGESTYRLDIYSSNGNKIGSTKFDIEYTDIIFDEDRVIIYGGTDCIVRTVKGDDKFIGTLGSGVNLLIPTSSSDKFIVLTGDSLDTIELN